MRNALVLIALFFGLAISVSARQHVAAGSAAVPAAPPVAARPVANGSGQAAAAHTSTHPHSGSGHVAPVHTKPSGVARKTQVPPGSSLPIPSPLGGAVNSVTGYPGVGYCNPRSRTPLQGLNACPPNNAVVLPFSGGAIYVPIPYYADSGAPPPDQPEDQQDAANQPPPDNGARPLDQEAPSASVPYRGNSNDVNQALAEFVFVKRDGSKLYAVAYSFTNDKLHYVTKDGIRRTVGVDTLDIDATQKINEDLGNTINLPAPLASGVALNVSPAVF
ncbi:MAG: hypothetical protein WBR26_16070 [Candidatus Acidiferrum sp.]